MSNPIIMNMNFSNAFKECITHNKIIGRKSELKYIITSQIPAIIGEEVIPKLTSLNDTVKELLLATCKRIHYHNQMLKINLNTGEAEQYMPTAEDLFALDWQIIDDELLEEIKWRFSNHSLI